MLHLHCRSSSSTSNSPPSRSWSLQRANVWPLPPDFSSTSPMSRLRPRLSSTTPMLHLLRRSSSSTSISPPSRSWSPRDAFAAATERVRAGTLSPEDEHHLFDELLGQATPVPSRSLNGFIDLVKAKGLVSEMMNKGIPRPDIVFFSSIVNSLCKE
ncbi:hypothetical protein D1007_50178 [Hordeum vulgare]|nr:hypothetical protein D1007_50178 [Hordeum vulgare]